MNRAGERFSVIVGNVAEWSSWVKNARNGVAHRDPGMIDADEEWRTTIRITETIKWLMTCSFFEDLGLP